MKVHWFVFVCNMRTFLYDVLRGKDKSKPVKVDLERIPKKCSLYWHCVTFCVSFCVSLSLTAWTMWRLCTTSTAHTSTPVELGPSTPPVPLWRWDTGWRWDKYKLNHSSKTAERLFFLIYLLNCSIKYCLKICSISLKSAQTLWLAHIQLVLNEWI